MGEFVVRASVWLAVACYPAAAFAGCQTARCQVSDISQSDPLRAARVIWTVGCVAFLVHVVSSFHVFYDWSHATALAETAVQTEAMTGVRSGSGLWLNYVFAIVWLADVVQWWAAPWAWSRRSLGARVALHAFFLFMIVNGAIVFARGPVRVLGILVTLVAFALFGAAFFRGRGR